MSQPTSEANLLANRSGMDPRRLLAIFLICSAVVLILFFDHIFGAAWAGLGWRDPEVISGLGWHTSTIVGGALALAIVIGSYAYGTTRRFMMESASELMKVTWPDFAETKMATWAVLIASFLTAIFLYGCDTLSYQVFAEWLPKIWVKLVS